MPAIDLPLEELRHYTGVNPKPQDFDEFWSRAISELDAVLPNPEVTKADFESPIADCYDLFFTGVKGARIYAKLLKPKMLTAPAPVLLCFHGYSDHSGDWWDKLPYVAAGFIVVAMDCRGQGGKSQDIGGSCGNTFRGHIIRGLSVTGDCDNMLMRNIYLDTVQLARLVANMPDVNQQRMATMGGSQGGGLALACAALEPRITAVVAACPFLSDFKRAWEMRLGTDAYLEFREYFRRFDPLHKNEDAFFAALGYIDVHHLAPRIKASVLMGIPLEDTVCPPATQFAIYNCLPGPKEAMIYPDFAHETLPGFWDRGYAFVVNENGCF